MLNEVYLCILILMYNVKLKKLVSLMDIGNLHILIPSRN